MRTNQYNTGAELILLYKAQVLSYIEHRTAAIYHACSSSLAALSTVQDKQVGAVGMTAIEALNVCHLAPLSARRDMALLGLIHRTVLGRGPRQFAEFFKADFPAREKASARHRLQLLEYKSGHWSDFVFPGSRPADYIAHSMLGLVSVYNVLPAVIVESAACVASFQSSLQKLLIERANAGAPDWADTFSPRVPWHSHPLRRF